MGMAEDTYRLIRSDDGRAYAVPKLGPQIAVPLASRSGNSIRARLAASLHRQTGKVASASALSDCITVLDGEASELDPPPAWRRIDQPRHHAAARTRPKAQREWAIFARAPWAFCYDNIPAIPDWLSNALCKGVTGDAVLQRVLHTDDDIGVYSFQRVIALTTIAIKHDIAGDLADRILLVEPEVIDKRRTEADITAARTAALPGALGAVLDLVARLLRALPATVVA